MELKTLCNKNYSKEIISKKYTIIDLKVLLTKIGEKKSGKKQVLIDRLYDWIQLYNTLQTDINVFPPDLINLDWFLKLSAHKRKEFNDMERLIWTLQYYKLNSMGVLKKLKSDLLQFSKKINEYKKHLFQIKLIQNKYKQYYRDKVNFFSKYRVIDCINQEDFLTYDDLNEIPKKYLFIYKDIHDQKIYGFDIRSLITLFNDSKSYYNPYNNKLFTKQIKKKIVEFYYFLKSKKTKITVSKEIIKDPYLYIREKATMVFQIMNVDLNNYVDVNWFLNLNRLRLKKLYRSAEDIWNYRAQHLTPEIKLTHIPNNDAFLMPVNQFNKLTDINQMRKIILQEFYKFITEGKTIEECKTGAMWMLTALVEVSPEACNAMPWLLQQH